MAIGANKSAGYGVRSKTNLVRWVGISWVGVSALALILASQAHAQQYPFLPINAPGAPQGCMFPFIDHRGALWLAGCEAGSEGLFYFDGTRFIAPVKGPFPKGTI